jgi:hypothetical protein
MNSSTLENLAKGELFPSPGLLMLVPIMQGDLSGFIVRECVDHTGRFMSWSEMFFSVDEASQFLAAMGYGNSDGAKIYGVGDVTVFWKSSSDHFSERSY